MFLEVSFEIIKDRLIKVGTCLNKFRTAHQNGHYSELGNLIPEGFTFLMLPSLS
jgi:hypothetical protein